MKLKELLLQYFIGKEKHVDPKIISITKNFLSDIRSVKMHDLEDSIDEYDETINAAMHPMYPFTVFNVPDGNFHDDNDDKVIELFLAQCDLRVRVDQDKCIISYDINTPERDDLHNYLCIQDIIDLDGGLELYMEYNDVYYPIKDIEIDFNEYIREPEDDKSYKIYIHSYISTPEFNNDDWDSIGA